MTVQGITATCSKADSRRRMGRANSDPEEHNTRAAKLRFIILFKFDALGGRSPREAQTLAQTKRRCTGNCGFSVNSKWGTAMASESDEIQMIVGLVLAPSP